MKEIEDALKKAYFELEKINISPFSVNGFNRFRLEISSFIIQFFTESYKNAKRTKTDTISSKHVEDAIEYLTMHKKFKYANLFNTLAGLFLGSALTFLIAIATQNIQFSFTTVFVYMIFGITGSFLLGYNMFKQ